MRNRIRERAIVRALHLTAPAPVIIPRGQDESSGWDPTHIHQPITHRPPVGTMCDPLIRHRREDPVTQLLRQEPKRRAILLLHLSRPGMQRPVRAFQGRVRATPHPPCHDKNLQGQATPLLTIRPLPPHSAAPPHLVANPARVVAVAVDAPPALQDPPGDKSAGVGLHTLHFQECQPLRNAGVILIFTRIPKLAPVLSRAAAK